MTETTEPTAAAAGFPDVSLEHPARVGRNELGHIDVAPRAVEKIAALAALEIPDAGGVGGGLLTRAVAGASYLGWLRPDTDKLPKVTADVDGGLGFLEVEMSVRWPAPIAKVTDAVRERMVERIATLIGIEVREVNIQVVELITAEQGARVA